MPQVKISKAPRVLWHKSVPGLTDALTDAAQKAIDLNEAESSKPERDRKHYAPQFGVDSVEVVVHESINAQINAIQKPERPKRQKKTPEEVEEQLFLHHMEKQGITPADVADALGWLTSGLMSDGGWHKQWYIEETLKRLIGEKGLQAVKRHWEKHDYGWQDGIAP